MIYEIGNTAFLPSSSSVLTVIDSRELTIDGKYNTVPVTSGQAAKSNIKLPKEAIKFVQWGDHNDLPLQVIRKVYKNVTTSANIEFNSRLGVGDGIMVYKKVRNGNKIEVQEVLESEAPEIFDFMLRCNMTRSIQEQIADLTMFGDANIELSLSADCKVVMMAHKELCYSRLSETNDRGDIEWHGYSADWSKGAPSDVLITPYLDRRRPYLDLLQKIGKAAGDDGKFRDSGNRRFIMSMSQPVPGRFYYNKPFWWSIFEAGWYDFACAIPEFKRALINNQMVIKYHIQIADNFFPEMFKDAGVTKPEEQETLKKDFLKKLDDFLAGTKNAGKSLVSQFRYSRTGDKELQGIKVIPIDNGLKGGEYINDSEEVSNIICYAMGVHPSLIGANPGKNGTISGSEARELFIIKQSLLKPLRDALVMPLYIAKTLNNWDKDIHFAIPNLMLTTLDQNTGSQKTIGNEKL